MSFHLHGKSLKRAKEDGTDAKLREYSKKLFGSPNCPLKVVVNNINALFGADIDQLSFAELREFAKEHPQIQRLTHTTLIEPPTPPAIHEINIDNAAKFLQASRHYRFMFPMLDKLTKRPGIPSNDSTRLKFDVGIDLDGCFHVGAGSITASSAPEAAVRIDMRYGDDAFKIKPRQIGDRILVSDVAMPSQDGLGCSRSPILVNWLNEMARADIPIIAKVTLEDLTAFKRPFKIMAKPRAHNMEVIVSLNIPGVDLMSVDELLRASVATNSWRNIQCEQGAIDEVIPIDEESFNMSLMHDPRDFEDYGARDCLPFAFKERRTDRFHLLENFDKEKCRSMALGGFMFLSDNVNMFTIKALDNCGNNLDKMIDYCSKYYSEADAASIIVMRTFVHADILKFTRNGKKFNPKKFTKEGLKPEWGHSNAAL